MIFLPLTNPAGKKGHGCRPAAKAIIKHAVFTLALLLCAGKASAQQMLPPLNLDNVTISQVFSEIESKSRYAFIITDDIKPELQKRVTVKTTAPQLITAVMEMALKNTSASYSITGNQVAVFRKGSAQDVAQQERMITVTGLVNDENGLPLPGVTVVLKSDTRIGTSTGVDGTYRLRIPEQGSVLAFSFIGTTPREVTVDPNTTTYNVTLEATTGQIATVRVVNTGIFQRDKASFTGSTASFTGSELKNIGNQNVLESLKSLDPSFVMVDNQLMGSNPNTVPIIELRGQGSATINAIEDEFSDDPNQPLFILNGVEVKIERITDLDMNRVESITILKDAGSTAIYGSKGANGVIVVETIKPVAGEYRIYYNGDFSVDTPDLSVYNMMNSSEKLEFERLSGKYRYGRIGPSYAPYQAALDNLYNIRLAEIERGVDTYWLREPVRTGFTHSHSVRVSGGNEYLAVDAGGKFKQKQGVMKGSGRDTWEGNLALTFRNDKLIISNTLDLLGYKATESPYGKFSDWVDTSPYFRMRNEDGTVSPYLQTLNGPGSVVVNGIVYSSTNSTIANPLYNATRGSIDESDRFEFSDNFLIQYDFTEHFRAKAGAQISRRQTREVQFVAPDDTRFDEVSIYEKGTYANKEIRRSRFKAHLDGTYGRIFNQTHGLTLMARAEVSQNNDEFYKTELAGFPLGTSGSPNLSKYKPNAAPEYNKKLSRAVALLGIANYNYKLRYLLDFTYRIDGATTFGSNELYKSFWSVGAGWNLDREAFAQDIKWLDRLKLRATYGLTGNQNIGTVYSKSVYQYFSESNIFGQGIFLKELGNPNVPWQVASDTGIGIDFQGFGNRVSLTVDFFYKKTSPLIVNVPQIGSTGLGFYPMHLGKLTNKGVDFVLSVSPVYNVEKSIFWTIRLTGSYYMNRYDGFGSLMDNLNESLVASNILQRYADGYSPKDIWAVRSYGIDPASGEEIFITKNGDLTYTYNPDDMVVVGNERPTLMGVASTTFRYKNFSASASFRYSFGSSIYNNALFQKVENITKSALDKNQDKRALYDRWKEPGDISMFKSISIVESIAPMTSRFVQKNNYLSVESVSLSYELLNNPWLKKNLGIHSLKTTFYMKDILRFETSKTERGIEYPFARSISLGLNLSF